MKKIVFCIAIILLLFNNLIFSQNSLPNNVTIKTLDNGLQVLLIENKALPMVGINTVVKVGSAYETFATSGMSHMLEHLLFNGTETMNQRELYDAVDLIGGYNNANTSEFYTNFMMVTPAENIYEGIRIQSQMLFHSVLPEEKYEKEKGIVLEEIGKTLANTGEQLERNVISCIYKGHALSLPTLGTYETIKHMKRDDVYAFYKNYYKPNNMIVSVIGNFDTKKMLEYLNKYYGSIAPGDVEYPQIPDWKIGLEKIDVTSSKVYHKFYEGKGTHLQLFYKLPDAPRELYSMLEEKFNDKSEVIKNTINNKFKYWVKDLYVSARNKYVANYLEFDFTVVNKSSYNDFTAYVDSLLKSIKITFSKTEIQNAIAEAKTTFLRNTEKPHMFGIYNAEIFAVEGIEGVISKYSGEGYKKVAEKFPEFLIKSKPIVILQEPEKNSTSEGKSELVTREFNLGNDFPKLIVRQNKNSDLLAIHYLLAHKSEYEQRYGKNAAYIWHEAFGERTKSKEFLKRASEFGFKFTVNDNPYIPMDDIYLSPDFGYIRVETATADIEKAIEFLNNEMLNFTPTKEEFNSALRMWKMVQMMKPINQAKSTFEDLVDETLYGKAKKTKAKQLTYESLLDFGRHYFIPANMIIAVVSSAQPEEISKLFTDFKTSVPKDFITTKPKEEVFRTIDKPVKIERNVNGKRAYLYYGYQVNVEKNEKAALKALSLILNDKIVFDIREKQGLAYGMSAGIEQRRDKAMFYIEMGTRPENVEKLVEQFPEKFTRDYLGEITEKELQKRVNKYLGRMLFRRLSSINQGFYLCRSLFYHNDFNYDQKQIDALKKVTLEEVKKVADKYLDADKNEVIIIVK